MKKIFPFMLIFMLSILIAKDFLFIKQFPSTHDGSNHLARIANYYIALKEGQVPPRFAPNLEAGLGYTSLNFNYPLANIFALPMLIANIPVELSLKLIFFMGLVGGGLAMFAYLKLKYQTGGAMIGAFAYILAPYFIGNIYIRGNIGETLAFALLPVVLWSTQKINQNKWYELTLSVSFAMLMLSHNLIAVLSIPLISLLVFLEKPNKKTIKKIAISAGLGIALTAFFWIPALAEKKYIVLDQSPLSQTQLVNHFVRLKQLISSQWDHGYSYSFPVDGMNFSLGIFGWLAVLGTMPIILAQKEKRLFEKVLWTCLIITLGMMLKSSQWVWEIFPVASIIQFPWRLLFFAVFFSAILTAYIIEKTKVSIGLIITVFLILSIRGKTLGINYFTHTDDHWFSFPLNTTVLNENDPLWYDRDTAFAIKDDNKENPIILNASGSAQIKKWTGTKHEYEVEVNNTATIIEKTMYFPGWEVEVDGEKVSLEKTKERFGGLINFDVPNGKHTITTRFTQNTSARLIGNGLSVGGFIGLVYLMKKKKI